MQAKQKPKIRTCCICKEKSPINEMYNPPGSMKLTCSVHSKPECAIALSKQLLEKKRAKDSKEFRKETKRIKAKYEGVQEWAEKLSVAHNAYTRARDYDKNCISCDKPIRKVWKNYHAGHFIPYGSKYKYSPLRFDWRNNNGQCATCNTYRNGRQADYEIGLIKRYGQGHVDEIKELKRQCDHGEVNGLNVTEMQEMTKMYRRKLKELQQ